MKSISYCAFLVLLLLTIPAAAQSRVFSTSVLSAKGESISNDTYDGWADTSTALAHKEDQPFDVSCDVIVVRSGDVVQHATIPKLIDSQALMNHVRALDADVFVIDQLKVCGDAVIPPGSPAGTEFAGCASARSPGPLILVNRGDPTGQSLIHEIGHKAGLGHTFPTAQCTLSQPAGLSLEKYTNLMYCMNHSKRLVLTQSNCNALKNTGFASGQPDLVAPAREAPASPVELSPMGEFLLYGFSEAIPFPQINALSGQDVNAVRELTSSPNDEYWAPAALVLGLRGNAEDLKRLMVLADRAAQFQTPGAFRAQTSIPDAIAFFIMRGEATGREEATAFLLNGINIEAAAGRSNTSEDAPLIARSYLRAAALTGEPSIADAAIEIANQQLEIPNQRTDVNDALAPDFQNEVADLALRVMDEGLVPALNSLPATRGDAVELLQQRSNDQLTLPVVPQTLRQLGVPDDVLQRFDKAQGISVGS